MSEKEKFMLEAIDLSFQAMRTGSGGPFGAIIVKNGKIIARGMNKVTANNDPTAHAEIVAIRNACEHLQTFQLTGCEVYTSCEPCPMCLGAIYWARPDKIYFANTKKDAAEAGFDDQFIYEELNLNLPDRKFTCEQLCRQDALKAFEEWKTKTNKVHY
ncbi:MAG TPA: nucleoside deaminase [Bacteroidia bacterium]|jgi:tRNA(Arg) A34 adenosine deaminase TadA|nr:nucleoside deaminase [Bacteroidia bacterium]